MSLRILDLTDAEASEHGAARPIHKTLRDLTLPQVLALLQIHGGRAATAIARELRAQSIEARPGAEDYCTLAQLGLIFVDRTGGYLTDKGLTWSDAVIGD